MLRACELQGQENARPIWALYRQLQFPARRFYVFSQRLYAASSQLAVFHLRDAVLSNADCGCERGLRESGSFAQFAQTVQREVAVHLSLDAVDAVTVPRPALTHVIKRGHRFFLPFLGLRLIRPIRCFNRSWC